MPKDNNQTQAQLPSEFYEAGQTDRKPYEDRAKLIAKLTLPYAIRDENNTGTNALTDSNNQSYGGQLVNTLKAKMGMALLPPSTSSFRFAPEMAELAALTGGDPDNKAKVASTLSGTTTRVNTELEAQQIRNSLFDLIIQLIVVGSTVVEKRTKKKKGKKKGIILHNLQSFVVELDNNGDPLKICFVETLKTLPAGVTPKEEQDEYKLYTMATMDTETDKWTVVQEVEQELVGKEQTYADYDALPFRYLGWTWISGDQYHRPYAEDYFKDLEQLDKTSKLLTDGGIVAAKMLLFVNERGGRTRKDAVANSANGDVIDGSAEDVTALQINKNFDFQMPMEREQNLKRELAKAFLMNESVTRDAERVTAEEISFMARELETSSLSGIYSKLSLQWSKWIIVQIMVELGITFKTIDVEIITGLDALGRSQEAQKLDSLLQRAAALGLSHWFKDEEVLARYAAFEGVNTVDLMKTPTEVATETAERNAAAAKQQADEAAATAAGTTAGTNAANTATAPQPQQ